MPPAARYKMGTLARLTGLSPVLLRAWERRHGLLRPERTEGGHRLYTEDDLRVLRRVKALLGEGRAIGEVGAMGRGALLAAPPPEAPAGADGRPAAAGARDGLVEAARHIDPARAERALDDAFAAVGPERVIADVIEPALRRVGELWAAGECSVAGEHVVANLVQARLQRLLEAAHARASGPPAVVTCLPDEQHALGSLTVAYWLARRGRTVAWLGAALPLEDLERAIDRHAPDAAFLSVTRAALLEAHAPRLTDLVRRRAGVRFHVGGAGATAADGALRAAGAGVVRAATFAELDAALRRPPPRRRGRRRV